jgi:hypothetical protein
LKLIETQTLRIIKEIKMMRKIISTLLIGLVLAFVSINIGGETSKEELDPCSCKCSFNKTPIVTAGDTGAPGGGTRYSFTPNVNTTCGGTRCSISTITYSWTVTGTATFTIAGGITNAKKIDVDVTGAGDVTLSCTVTVTCSDGTTCSSTGTKTFRNLKP